MKNNLLILLFITSFNTLSFSQKSWEQKANFSGGARNSSIAFSINGKGYLGLGQSSSGTKLYDFYEYNPSSNSWTKKTSYPGNGSFAATSFAIKGKGYVCFGANSSGSPQSDLYEYDPSADTWTKKANFPGNARYGASWFVINDTAFILTGSPGGSPYLSDVWMYIPATNGWYQKANFSGGSRVHGAGFTSDGIGYFGTGINSSSSPNSDIWQYNKSKDSWSRVADLPGKPITGLIGFEIDKIGYMGTGFDLSNFYKDFYQYNSKSNSWSKLDSIPSSQSVRGGSVSFVINGTCYLGTGYGTSTASSITDIWSYSPKPDCDAKISSQPTNQTANLNTSAKFTISTGDTTKVSYRWQGNFGSGYTDISNGGQFNGAKTFQLTVSSLKFNSNNGNKFRCITSNSICIDTSYQATLFVKCINLVKTEPSSISSYNGSNIKISFTPYFTSTSFWQINDGSGYKNQVDGGQYSGVTKDTLSISDLRLSNNNLKFRSILSFNGCSDTTNASTVGVYCKPILKNGPANQSVFKGSNCKFGVTKYDNGTTFQWQIKIGSNFQNLSDAGQFSGSNTDSILISNVNITNADQQLRCVLSYKSCSDTSNPAILNVLCNPIVQNNPNNQTKTEGENASFTATSLDSKATFTWQGNIGFGFINLNNSGQFSDVKTDVLKISNLLLANDNQKFRCIQSSEGCYDTSESATLRVFCKPLIKTQPKDKSVSAGDLALITFIPEDIKSSFIWQSDLGFGFQNISNAGQFSGTNNDSLLISSVTLSNNKQKYRCIISLGGCKDTTDIAILYVSCKSIIDIQPINKAAQLTKNTFLNLTTSKSNASFKWQSDIGFGFQNLSNAGQFNGVYNDTLFINNLTVANDNQVFRCLLSDGSCFDTSSIVSLSVKNGKIQSLEKNKDILIYPNPSNDFITIRISANLFNNSYKIIDQQGKIIENKKLVEKITKINLDNLSPGIYLFYTEPLVTRTILIKQ